MDSVDLQSVCFRLCNKKEAQFTIHFCSGELKRSSQNQDMQ